MNAKKIMGAVLVALLAAALFVGAGAAATMDADGDTVFFYQDLSSVLTEYQGTWNNGDYSFTIDTGMTAVTNTALPEGKYSYNDSVSIYLKKPTATINGLANGTPDYIVANGGKFYQDASYTLDLTAASPNAVAPVEFVILDSDNVPVKTGDIRNGAFDTLGNLVLGKYTVKVVFDKNSGEFATGAPDSIYTSDVVFTFTVAKANEIGISAGVDSILQGKTVAVTITGKPGLKFYLSGDFTDVGVTQTVTPTGTETVDTETYNVYTMPNTGEVVIYMKTSETSGSQKITVTEAGIVLPNKPATESISITIKKGTITGKTDKESYFLGNDVKLSGTTTAGDKLYVYIAGTNKDFEKLGSVDNVEAGAWDYEIKGDKFLNYDAGTYTVYIAIDSNADAVSKLTTYTTVSLILKQPFISITEAPAVAVQDTDYKVTGTAEATDDVKYYIFGTNFFAQAGEAVEKGAFEIEFKIQNMDAGQYFMVVQHPMYDGVYNIQVKNVTGTATDKLPVYKYDSNNQIVAGPLFNVTDRQKTNAAQAFVDELAGQNIDDMYVKLSFVVAAPSSVINPIPAEITQGSKLTVSGQTNVGEGKLVTVEMISTAFAAQPKETVGSASFIALTTKTNEDGSWEITFDTTGLNVDEYTVTAAVQGLNSATAKVNVIEGAPTEQPTEQPTTAPTQTEQPTETPVQTPGFGALAALAGLGAVAVLLLRRE